MRVQSEIRVYFRSKRSMQQIKERKGRRRPPPPAAAARQLADAGAVLSVGRAAAAFDAADVCLRRARACRDVRRSTILAGEAGAEPTAAVDAARVATAAADIAVGRAAAAAGDATRRADALAKVRRALVRGTLRVAGTRVAGVHVAVGAARLRAFRPTTLLIAADRLQAADARQSAVAVARPPTCPKPPP